MASSNRHWPSMFKSKPCNAHHQWQHDINPSHISSGCSRPPYTSVPGCEERSPEPKPRWNPKPEQIRILEAIFNSGMVNPPRDEIRRIRAQLQEFGQVGDANVFYWFQNRKSRSKHKQRHLQTSKQQHSPQPPPLTPSSSSSSSDKSSPPDSGGKTLPLPSPGGGGGGVLDVSNSPAASLNQTYFQNPGEFLPEPLFFPVTHQVGGSSSLFSHGLCFPELSNVVQIPPDQTAGAYSGLLLTELMSHGVQKKDEEEERMKLQQHLCYAGATLQPANNNTAPSLTTLNLPSTINNTQGVGESGAVVGPMGGGGAKSTVFINDVAFEVAVGPFNVREAFGDDAVLLNSYGHPLITNEWGATLQSLQDGAFYYLVRTLNPSSSTPSSSSSFCGKHESSSTELIW